MTWEELVKKAKEMGWEYKKTAYTEYLFSFNEDNVIIQFYPDGDITADDIIFSQNRTPDQMYQIMLALR